MDEQSAPAEQSRPSLGGTYLRQPDGSLQRLPDDADVVAPAASPETPAPQKKGGK